jgi:hypothetical protein
MMQFRGGWFGAYFFAELALHLIDLLLDDHRANLVFFDNLLSTLPPSYQFFHPIKAAQLLSLFRSHISILSGKGSQQSEDMLAIWWLGLAFMVLIVIDGEGFVLGFGVLMHRRMED